MAKPVIKARMPYPNSILSPQAQPTSSKYMLIKNSVKSANSCLRIFSMTSIKKSFHMSCGDNTDDTLKDFEDLRYVPG